ncbi:kelch-like protein [Corallococcus aberystwythensis]|uniref:Kelch-like protein n=1 Tax=Corallococcus aberystwythensis TaxID=2316722 RepID=A0A3A8QEQ8_9BACT|nr:kelch-like protein [Corallococcus aberystwythensis]
MLAGLPGCEPGINPVVNVPSTGSVRLAVSTPQAAPGDVSRVKVTVSASDMASLSTELSLTDGTWGGVLGAIPPGSNRTFLAQAFSASNALLYEGRAEGITVTAGSTGLVTLVLQAVTDPPPFINEAPIIDSMVASGTTVHPGGSIFLAVSAHDPNAGDTMSYAWTAPSGSFGFPSNASTNWTAPLMEGEVPLSLTVSDQHGASLVVNLTVSVSAVTGAQEVTIGFNTSPGVTSLTSSRSLMDVGQQTALSVVATDGDGDPLSYQWSATCEGSFTGASTANATFTPSARPLGACNNCQVRVTVTDGRGGLNTGSVALCVAQAAWRLPPVVTYAQPARPSASAQQTLTFEVRASDPAGSALTFDWTASAGTLGATTTDASSSIVAWTAPACVDADPPSLTVTVTNALGMQSTKTFVVTGLLVCTTEAWASTGAMVEQRFFHSTTVLANGKVLAVAGSKGTGGLQSAELYDPATGTWSPTGSLSLMKGSQTATLLPNGKVVVAGTSSRFTEVYDPATGTWSVSGSMSAPRQGHQALLLPNGKALIVGGMTSSDTATAELYDPATGTWSLTGSMSVPRYMLAAVLLPNGKVLVSGGTEASVGALATAELYDPATGTWSPTGSMVHPRNRHTATLLPNGKVLVSGGYGTYAERGVATAELYDPSTGTWSPTASLALNRYLHEAVLLPNGKVFVSGGIGGEYGKDLRNTPELYDPATGTWSQALTMPASRGRPTVTLLPTGKVLVSGGYDTSNAAVTTAELYTP